MDLLRISKVVIENCMGLKLEEACLILCDTGTKEIGEALFNAASLINPQTYLMEMHPRKVNGEELPQIIAETMKFVDVIIAPTTRSITHTHARREACNNGARVASMPGVTTNMMLRTFDINFDKMFEVTRRLTELLDRSTEVLIKTDKGTDLNFNISNRKGIADTGQLREKGQFGNLPAGEAYIAPVEGSANGILVVDAMMAGVGLLDSPIVIVIKDGFAQTISGGEQAQQFTDLLNSVNDTNAKNVAEFGIGTNPRAQITGKILEDEKVLGTIHIAFGNNVSMGGKIDVPIHLDGVVMNPTVYVDGIKVLEEGKILL